ncbi:MAG TPA: ABC transporter permease, partial [Stellaceae bacterium]|nr:ABC transporter permease [Stellaceae bacterium]
MSFLLKKLLYLLPVLLAVSLLTYFLSALLPGDVVAAMLGDQATPDAVAELRHKLGLDAPLWRQYVDWLARILTGDFGVSRVSGEKVLGAILERLPVSLELMGLAELGAILIAVPIGIWAALRAGSAIDRWLSGSAFFLLPMPSFLLAILLIFVMAVRFHLLPSTGFQSLHEGVIGNLRSMALPAATLALLEWPA